MVLSFDQLSGNRFQFSYDGVPSSEYVVIKSTVHGDTDGKWIPDTKKPGFFKRVDPIIRFSANFHIPRRFRCCEDQWELISVSWTREPSPEDHAYEIYQHDIKTGKFIGFTKSLSQVKTAAKKWMREKQRKYNSPQKAGV